MSKIVARMETITPETAVKYLEKNKRNRPHREAVSDKYSVMMKGNQWVPTHQGIAFDEEGWLLDGQHRLQAIIKAGMPVTIMVTRGVTASIDNGIEVNAMDVIDAGKPRSVGDQLHLVHGVVGGNQVAAALNVIAEFATGRLSSLSTPQAVAIMEIYGKHIDIIRELIGVLKPARKGPVVGAMAFARASHPKEIDEFATMVGHGENLKRGQPAFTFREWLIKGVTGKAQSSVRRYVGESAFNAAYNHIHNNTLVMIKAGDNGWKFFAAKQRASVEKVRARLGL